MKLFILKKLANLGFSFFVEHRDFFVQTSATVINWWKGKKLAIIGAEGTGKDTLWNRLQGLAPLDTPELKEGRIPQFKIDFRLSDGSHINLNCKRSLNRGGEENHRDQENGWRAVCEDADVIFYLVSIEELIQKTYRAGRVQKDLEWLLLNLPYLKKNSHIHILINKIDHHLKDHTQYEAFKEKMAEEKQEFDQFVRENLSPWDKSYTGSTLISVYNEHLYLKGIETVFNRVHQFISK